jgi:hypothetical protein
MLVPVIVATALAEGRVAHFSAIRNVEEGLITFFLQAAVFSAAALAMVLVRQAIYAAVLAIAAVAGVTYLNTQFEPDESRVAVSFAVCAVFATLLAWLAVRYDWSLRR